MNQLSTNVVRQQMAFPEVATLRKGTPKVKGGSRNDFIQGSDLGNKFRVSFYPGTNDAKAAFAAAFPGTYVKYDNTYRKPGVYAEPDGFEVDRIRAMVPFRSVFDAWEWANEAHSAGRMVAKADDTHYLMLRDPNNGEYLVKSGEPFTEYQPGMKVTYERNGKQFSLPIRTVGRLKLFIPQIERMVFFTLKTTSFYDRLNIDQNLSAIEFLANTLNGGNAAGIPFFIYRREQEICWNKPDGSAQRIKKWLVNIEADPEWVKAATARMASFALTGTVTVRALAPVTESRQLTGPVSPVEPDEPGDLIEEDYGDQNYVDATPEPEEPPAQKTAQVTDEAKKPATAATAQNSGAAGNTAPKSDAGQATNKRPYQAVEFKQRFDLAVKVIEEKNHLDSIGDIHRRIVASIIDTTFNGSQTMRYEVCEWLTGYASTKDMSKAQIKTIMHIAQVVDFDDMPCAEFIQEIKWAHDAALKAKGQQVIPGM